MYWVTGKGWESTRRKDLLNIIEGGGKIAEGKAVLNIRFVCS